MFDKHLIDVFVFVTVICMTFTMAGVTNCATFLPKKELLELLKRVPSGYKTAKDPFFDAANQLVKPFVKQGVVSFDDEDDYHRKDYISCNVPGCQKEFNTVYEYESHYNTLHRYLCNQCKKCLPTPHFLDLHILEQHDTYFSLLAERKPMYSCFLEECKHVSATPLERKDHCIRSHKFPANFRFETSPPITSSSQVKSERKDSQGSDESMTDANNVHKTSKIIKNFTFGHQKQKVFDGKNYAKILTRKNRRENKMEVETASALENSKTVEDLMDSLPT